MRLIARRLVTFPKAYGGQPVPFGKETFETSTDNVVAFGRFASYGDFVNRMLVKLDSGEFAQVCYGDQDPDTARWLRREMRKWTDMPVPTREVAWGTCWKERE